MIPVNKKTIFAIEQSELKLQKSMPLNGFFLLSGFTDISWFAEYDDTSLWGT
jgi:hypothetical protein